MSHIHMRYHHIAMSHGTHINESWRISIWICDICHIWVMAHMAGNYSESCHIAMSHGTHINESWRISIYRIWICDICHICYTYDVTSYLGMSHIGMSHMRSGGHFAVAQDVRPINASILFPRHFHFPVAQDVRPINASILQWTDLLFLMGTAALYRVCSTGLR